MSTLAAWVEAARKVEALSDPQLANFAVALTHDTASGLFEELKMRSDLR